MLAFLSTCFPRRQHQQQQQHHQRELSVFRPDHSIPSGFGVVRVFSSSELKIATRNYSPDLKIGEGGFGSVYKGFLPNGTVIAVKKLSLKSNQGKEEFLNEVKLLSTVQHRNLIKLLGCCAEEAEEVLVYEYLKNRSLDKFLFGHQHNGASFLEWSVRLGIIVGTARGLLYLHEDSRVRIIHRDIKASNILLDDKFCPKIADFGLAKLFNIEQTHASTRVAGTFGYLAPEYALNGRLTDKADVYSFGVVALELVSGRKHTDTKLPSRKQRLLDVAWKLYKRGRLPELIDPRMNKNFVEGEVLRVIHIALLCTQAVPDLRPSMSRVVTLLAGRSQIQEKPTMPPFINQDRPIKTLKPAMHSLDHGESSSSSSSTNAGGSMSSSVFSH